MDNVGVYGTTVGMWKRKKRWNLPLGAPNSAYLGPINLGQGSRVRAAGCLDPTSLVNEKSATHAAYDQRGMHASLQT